MIFWMWKGMFWLGQTARSCGREGCWLGRYRVRIFCTTGSCVIGKGSGWEDTGFAFFELPEVGDKPESGGSGGDRCPECAGEVELKSKDGTDGAEVNEGDEDGDDEGGGSKRALLRVMTRAR